MKFTFSWLKDHLDTNHSLRDIVEKLTDLGLEVENVTNEKSGFIISKITEVTPHPNADNLNVCMVDNGEEILQIVCGAPNVKKNLNVVLATVGTVIPVNHLTIKKSKIRGITSNGMICSSYELNLGEDHDGILELDQHAIIGQDFFENDPVIDIAITPNRGDCLGVRGIARDLAAAGMGKLIPLNIPKINTNSTSSPINVKIEDNTSCVIGCHLRGIKNIPSPKWLQKRLKAIDINPISALVDITNYLNITFNRPMHVYDADKIENMELIIRKASPSDSEFIALNDKSYKINQDITVIADSNKILSIAGIIGGKTSGCTMETSNIFLEVASFDAIDICKNSRALGISTDASYRFERELDQNFMLDGIKIAIDMIMNLCGGENFELIIKNYTEKQAKTIPFNIQYLKKISGMPLNKERSLNILSDLGFLLQDDKVSPPSWRNDIQNEADLAEEIIRIIGYDNIPVIPLEHAKPVTTTQQLPLQNILTIRGMHEVITWSFMDSKKLPEKKGELLIIKNPIAENLDVMRPSIIPNLLEVMEKNFARDEIGIAIFELGPTYTQEHQEQVLSGLRAGLEHKRNIYQKQREYDIFDVKADVLQILSHYNVTSPQLTRDTPKYYHPGRSGCFRMGKTILAYFGELLERFNNYRVMIFEVFIERIPKIKHKKKQVDISIYPAVYRDFAFVVKQEATAEEIVRIISTVDKKIIKEVDIFDIYKSNELKEQEKSIALSVKLQAHDRTLSHDEIETLHTNIIQSVHKKIGGILRKDY